MGKSVIWVVFLLILVQGVFGAGITGSIYDFDLNKMGNVIVEVDTSPKQTYISKEGDYEFNIPKGSYRIYAKYVENGEILYDAGEEIVVKEEGDYIVDLIMFPYIGPGDLPAAEGVSKNWYFLGIILLILVLAGGVWYFMFKKNRKTEEGTDDLDKVLSIIKKEGGRINQKDLRSRLGLSEAKISLMISDLESRKKIRKIKRGRGNIIILSG